MPLFAQQGNNWVFGLHGGLTFNSSPPKVFVDSVASENFGKSNLDTLKNAAANSSSISDCQGRLLFYTSGLQFWDSTHHLMPHGFFSEPIGVVGRSSCAIIIPPALRGLQTSKHMVSGLLTRTQSLQQNYINQAFFTGIVNSRTIDIFFCFIHYASPDRILMNII